MGESRATRAVRVRNSSPSGFSGVTLMTMNQAETATASEWASLAVVPLPIVARVARITARDLHNAIVRGQLHPVERGRGRPVMLSRGESMDVLTAAALATSAGLVFASALRAVQAGATFPLPTLPEMAAAS